MLTLVSQPFLVKAYKKVIVEKESDTVVTLHVSLLSDEVLSITLNLDEVGLLHKGVYIYINPLKGKLDTMLWGETFPGDYPVVGLLIKLRNEYILGIYNTPEEDLLTANCSIARVEHIVGYARERSPEFALRKKLLLFKETNVTKTLSPHNSAASLETQLDFVTSIHS